MLQWHPPEGIRGKIFRLQLNRNIVSAVSQDLKGFEILLMKYLIESYSKLFASRGGLSDFIIYDADVQLRNQLNEKYNDEVKRVWNIMKDYI